MPCQARRRQKAGLTHGEVGRYGISATKSCAGYGTTRYLSMREATRSNGRPGSNREQTLPCCAMPIISPILANPLSDGRQSDRAMLVRRGVQRLLIAMGAHVLPEICLASGRRADLVALTRQGDIWIIEIKSSIEDFRVDRKWPEYRLHSDRFFFATHPGVPAGHLSGRVRLHPVGRLRRRDPARRAGAPAAAGHPQVADAAHRARRRGAAAWPPNLPASPCRRSTARASSASRQRGARLARMRCSVRRCMLRRRAVSETLRSHIS